MLTKKDVQHFHKKTNIKGFNNLHLALLQAMNLCIFYQDMKNLHIIQNNKTC